MPNRINKFALAQADQKDLLIRSSVWILLFGKVSLEVRPIRLGRRNDYQVFLFSSENSNLADQIRNVI